MVKCGFVRYVWFLNFKNSSNFIMSDSELTVGLALKVDEYWVFSVLVPNQLRPECLFELPFIVINKDSGREIPPEVNNVIWLRLVDNLITTVN